ncbi:MAG: terminase small subunit [Candidatus Thermoplasmatota archaeon]|jgi:phage terminase small subunit
MALNARQKAFINGLVRGKTGIQAAIDAGYSKKSAAQQASNLCKNPKVLAKLEAAQGRAGVTAEVVLGELLRIGRCDIGEAFNPDGTLKRICDIPEDTRRAMAGVEQEEFYEGADGEKFSLGRMKKAKFWDKNKALETLARSLKLLVDRTEVTVDGSFADALKEARERARKA